MACITYKQIGGSKQYVQPGAIGIYSVLCSLNHAGEKTAFGKNSKCSICVFNVLHDYIWNEASPKCLLVSRMNVTSVHTPLLYK